MGVFRAAKHGHQQMRTDSATRKPDDTIDAQRNVQRSPVFDLEDCASKPTYPKAVDNGCYTKSSRIPPAPQIHTKTCRLDTVCEASRAGISRPRGSLRFPANEVSPAKIPVHRQVREP
jgi:hypothetical protein